MATHAESQTEVLDRNNLRPVIIFHRRLEKLWYMENVGSGPALNVLVTGGSDSEMFNGFQEKLYGKEAS